MSFRRLLGVMAVVSLAGLVACSSDEISEPTPEQLAPLCPSMAPDVEPGQGDLPVAT